jgi:plastocyanin
MTHRFISALLVTAGLAIAGCGGGEDGGADMAASGSSTTSTTTSASPASVEKTDKVDIADYKFAPEAIEVATGTKVTWTNSDATAHTATADDSSFDTGDLDKGDSATVTFDKPGSFTYYCRFHAFMKATVEVQ